MHQQEYVEAWVNPLLVLLAVVYDCDCLLRDQASFMLRTPCLSDARTNHS